MFGYSMGDIGNIMIMQGFSGLSMFTVLLLMALGLAIIFGQMGVINMAHGEFMTIGAYTTVMLSKVAASYGFVNYYFLIAIVLAFILAFALGYFVEFIMIRHLYKRPLDTLLATWGLSLLMQQAFRSSFGAKEVSAELPEWMLGSFKPTPDIDIPINGVFVMALALLVTAGVYIFMYRSRWGLRVRATVQNRVMAGAVGINTKKVDRVTFALGCGIAGVAGAASLMGTIASAFGIAQAQSILQFFMTSSMGKVTTLLVIVGILMMKPEGLFASKLRK
jgi:urea transport system permease protein